MNAAFKDCFRIAAKTLRKRLEFLIKSDSRYPLNKKVDALVRAGYSYSEAIDIVLDETQNQELTRDSLMIEYEKPKTWRMNDLIAEYKKLLTALQRIANWPPLASYPGLYDELDIARLNLKHIQRYAKDALAVENSQAPNPMLMNDTLLARAIDLLEIVEGEGARNKTWQSWEHGHCVRLTDTPEWCAFYVALKGARPKN